MPQQTSRPPSAVQLLTGILRSEIILLLLLAVGCGPSDGLDRQPISGTVTLNGQPLVEGAILLEPATNASMTAVGATIRRGAFTIARELGPMPGRYRVRIYSRSETQAAPAKGQTERTRRPMVERLPDVYNSRTELHADVTAGGANRFRFELHDGPAS
jgi:hypothetical protein